MAIVTTAVIVLEETGAALPADAYGNNLAIECPDCRMHPVLLVARPGWPGSALEDAAFCRACGARVWMTTPVDPDVELEEVRVAFARVE